MSTLKNTFATSARCDCRNNHSSSSGRCNARDVVDPTRPAGGFAACERCRANCPCGGGDVKNTAAPTPSAGHTPGPWTVGANSNAGCADQRIEIHARNGGACVASHLGDGPEAEANARLIASSPALYEYVRACAKIDPAAKSLLASLRLTE